MTESSPRKIVLFNYFRSSTSYRVRIALNLKNLNYEYRSIHLLNDGGEQNTASYRRLNPMGGVPTLQDGDRVISQSVAIIEYLEEAYPDTYALLPKDAYSRAKVRQICENINSDTHPLQNLKVLQSLESQFHFDQAQRNEWAKKWIENGLRATELTLKQSAGQYCFEDRVTAADLFLVPQLGNAEKYHVDLDQFPLINRINKNCLHLDAFKKAHPNQQIDAPAELKTVTPKIS